MTALLDAASPAMRRRTRWPLVAAALLTVVLLGFVAGLLAERRTNPGGPDQAAQPAPPSTSSPDPAPPDGATLADGCLGGAGDLTAAVLLAQSRAPISQVGAAEFAGTYVRWATALPARPDREFTAARLLSGDATPRARDLSSPLEGTGIVTAADLTHGRYYVESFAPDAAVVSVLVTLSGSREEAPVPPADAVVELTLVPVDGRWQVRDVGGTRPVADMHAIGTPYAGGC